LVRDFCHSARDYVRALRGAGTHRQWRECAHRLKGAARGIGCWQIAVLCETAESMESHDDDVRAQIAGQIEALLESLAAAVR
ncbi:MAG: Hpt domain-containing protein, partial [Alphaproteobacteria bacterium]